MEAMITKLKEQVEALTQDLENSRLREQTAQEAQKRAVRQLRDAQDEYATLQLRETEALSKKEGLEQQLDQYETENLTLKSDLTLALKRIEDLQAAMQDVQDDSDSDLGSGRIGSSGDEDEDTDSDAETFASSSFRLGNKRPENFRSRHSSQSTSATNEDEADRSLRIEEERFALSPSAVNKTGGISLLESPTGNESHESEV
jgi:chromosome segregation ATPase